MSVNVEFAPEGQHGVVAEGTYLWDAAKRLGVRLPAECEGRGECDACAVVVKEGATLLSSLTNAERARLSPERLASGQRLACQAKVERAGTLVLQPVPQPEREQTTEETTKDIRTDFRDMTLQQKFATLAELEIIAAAQTFRAISDLSLRALGKGLDAVVGAGRARAHRQRASHRPPEHGGSARKSEGKKTTTTP
ncbi:MAG: (2Fe-2S)-binding protein [Acidobacteria bacterium]|nr:(2Fe-2S)-binding protein [Acidobacteriota bacterium]MCA1641053.1 (2Fe-2S)-binding protein [Acidobacteriota bacterium]